MYNKVNNLKDVMNLLDQNSYCYSHGPCTDNMILQDHFVGQIVCTGAIIFAYNKITIKLGLVSGNNFADVKSFQVTTTAQHFHC